MDLQCENCEIITGVRHRGVERQGEKNEKGFSFSSDEGSGEHRKLSTQVRGRKRYFSISGMKNTFGENNFNNF